MLEVEGTVATSPEQAGGNPAVALGAGSDDTVSATPTPEAPEAAGSGEAAASDDESDEDSLLSAEEYASVKDNPKALRKALNKAFTEKTQALAPFTRIIDALKKDPQAAVRQMATELNIPLAEAKAAVEADPESDALKSVLADSLGEDLAEKLLPTFERLVAKVVEEKTAPLTQAQEANLMERAIAESEAVVNGFKGAHPDYNKFEKRMLELSQEIQPAPGMDETKYLRVLYRLAKSEASEGDLAREAINRVNGAAKSSEPISAGTPPSQVSKRPPNLTGKALIRAAVEAAARGEIWEPE